ncbi:hypothetical protein RBG61_13290 [Paludicola sp. MB14-C6]|uniref:hypothetical protein n=1 Tax=Paludihabitans sp. MB14-C6 TaxID=3070656 RepID=UPI0027DDB3D2|nr:hypothetical protein [Paludicola sp. MB14-C6]WMJ22948.1 hypothetical protein RBG61_13290 [Paludicola sp. MB14-C6]
MINDVIKQIDVENDMEVNRKSQAEFLFEYQKSVLLNLSEQGVINDIQCQQCIEKLAWQFRK